MSKSFAWDGVHGILMLQPGRLQRTGEPIEVKKMPECQFLTRPETGGKLKLSATEYGDSNALQ